MDPLDPRVNIEQLLEQERKWMDGVKIACVIPKERDPVFATSVVWLIGQGYIPEISDHQYQNGELVLVSCKLDQRRLLSRDPPLGGLGPDWL